MWSSDELAEKESQLAGKTPLVLAVESACPPCSLAAGMSSGMRGLLADSPSPAHAQAAMSALSRYCSTLAPTRKRRWRAWSPTTA